MLSLWAMIFWVVVGILLAASFIRVRTALREGRSRDSLDDDDVRRILETGTLTVDAEPLDLNEIAEEERRFWQEEEWDGAEEW